MIPRNIVAYRPCGGNDCLPQLFVSETLFSRDLSQIVYVDRKQKALTTPNTSRKILDDAFRNTHLESVVLNEGLERLGLLYDDDDCCNEVFSSQ